MTNNQLKNFYDIYDLYIIPWWCTKPFIYTSIILGAIFIALCTYLLIRYIKSKKQRELTPWEWAKDKIVILAMDDLSQKEEYKKLYVDLIEILKKYFLLRFDWNVSTYTDEELLIFIKNHNEDVGSHIETIINNARMIKFANQHALQAQAGDSLSLHL